MTIVVIGPSSLLRAGLISLLSQIGFKSIEEADDVKQLTASARRERFNVQVLYLVRNSEDVAIAAKDIKAWEPSAKIVFVAQRLDVKVISACFSAGAWGYLLGTISGDALQKSLSLVAVGEKVFPSELVTLLPAIAASNVDRSEPAHSKVAVLSTRENEILRCLADGQSNKVIAKNLHISEATVKVHIKRILRKARVKNRTQAALWAVAQGIAAKSELPKARG